jgi:class 3 adenylate cyclase
VVLEETAAGDRSVRRVEIRTFLIADVRGYTRFSQEHGDEAASQLARSFADVVRSSVSAEAGDLVELRGDEALCAFDSARAALATAIDLQRRSREAVDGKPALPLGIGVGLDAGEAVPTEGGYRGRALNVAARLCSLAEPGEVLASETVAALAGRDGLIGFRARKPVRVKGIHDPIRFVEVVSATPLPPLPSAPPAPRARLTHKRLTLLALAASLIAGAAVTYALVRPNGGSSTLVPNSLAVIDPATNDVLWHVELGGVPAQVDAAGDRVWSLTRDQTIALVDLDSRRLVRAFGVPATTAGLAAAPDRAWVGDSIDAAVLELAPTGGRVTATIPAPPIPTNVGLNAEEGEPRLDAGALAAGAGALWFLSGDATLTRIDPEEDRVVARVRHKGVPGAAPAYVAVDGDAVWVYAWGSDLTRVDPDTNTVVSSMKLAASGPLAAGLGSVWIVDNVSSQIWQVDPGSPTGRTAPSIVRSIPLSGAPLGVAVGAGAVWVATADGDVNRIEPTSGRVTTIQLDATLASIDATNDAVFVGVD